jgi:TolB-like protein/DNA-binding winged helix-turn-helix (wHTH) protein
MEDRPVVFAFGDFEADEALRELRRKGRPVELQATPLRLLLYLLRNRDRVISKDELLDRVWSDTAVSEGALSTALKEIRSALGDAGSQQRVIQTLRGQGYRLIAPVEEHPATAPATSEPAPGAVSRLTRLVNEIHRRSLWQVMGIYLVGAWVAFQGIEALVSGLGLPEWVPGFAVVILILGLPIVLATAFVQEGVGAREAPTEASAQSQGADTAAPADARGLHLVLTWQNVILAGALVFGLAGIVAAGWLLLEGESPRSPETIRSIAVLPFVDMSPGGDQEYFADGMSEELINRLSKIEDLRVVARTSAFAFKGKNVDIREIGEQLDVGAVVEGSVRKAGDRLRITAQLVQVADGFHFWSETYERQLDDVFAIQDEVSRAIAGALEARLDTTQASQQPTADLRAYELYLLGRFFWNQRTEEGHRKAIQYFEQTLELDSEYALAYSGLADSYLLLSLDFDLLANYLAEAGEAATRAVSIDDSLAEGHASLGFYRWHIYHWRGAEVELRRALAINPAYATAHMWYACLLMTTGRIDESLAEIRLALELDPLSGIINAAAGRLHLVARDHDTAVDHLERALELNPDLPRYYQFDLASAYHLAGMEAEAVEAALASLGPGVPPEVESLLREASERSGLQGGVRKLLELEAARTGKPCSLASSPGFYAFVEEHESALGCLQHLQQEARHGAPLGLSGVSPLNYFKVSPWWDGLRSDPRFNAFLKSMDLDD